MDESKNVLSFFNGQTKLGLNTSVLYPRKQPVIINQVVIATPVKLFLTLITEAVTVKDN